METTQKYTIPADLLPYINKQAHIGAFTFSIVKSITDGKLEELVMVIERNLPRTYETMVYFQTKDDLIKSYLLAVYLPQPEKRMDYYLSCFKHEIKKL